MNVTPIRPEFAPPEIHARPVKIKGVWYQWVGPEPGRKPQGHPRLKLGPRGGVLLQVGQVWVDTHTSRLWVVHSFQVHSAHRSYPHRVQLRAYRGEEQRVLSELSLRQTMMVWDSVEEFVCALREDFAYAARFDSGSPWRGTENAVEDAQDFFGVDAYGNRQELVRARGPRPRGGPPRKGSVWRHKKDGAPFRITRYFRERGQKLWFHTSYLDGHGWGVKEYDAYDWYQRYVPVD